MNEEEIQQSLIAYQLMQRQMEELKQQIVLVERKFLELEASKQAIGDVSKLKEGHEVLIPLGSESYTYAKITKLENILVDVGAGIFVNKGIESAAGLIDKKKEELEKAHKEIQDQINNIASQMNVIAEKFEKDQQKKK